MKFTHDVAVVVWDDAVRHSDGSKSPVHQPERQTLVGWLLRYDTSGISVASEYNEEDGSWRDENFIPAGMIVSVHVYEVR